MGHRKTHLSCLVLSTLLGFATSGVLVHCASPFGALDDKTVVFVDSQCRFSARALEFVRDEATEVIPVPSSQSSDGFKQQACNLALERLAMSNPWIALLPVTYACGRLAAEGDTWLMKYGDGMTPFWADGYQPVGSGFDSDVYGELIKGRS